MHIKAFIPENLQTCSNLNQIFLNRKGFDSSHSMSSCVAEKMVREKIKYNNSVLFSDTDILAELNTMKGKVDAAKSSLIGHTNTFLDGSRKHCRLQECNLGKYWPAKHVLKASSF